MPFGTVGMPGHFKSTEMVRHPWLLIWGVWPVRYTGGEAADVVTHTRICPVQNT